LKNLDKEKYNVIPIAITKKGSWLVGDLGGKYLEMTAPSAGLEQGVSEAQSQSLSNVKEQDRNLTNCIEGEQSAQII